MKQYILFLSFLTFTSISWSQQEADRVYYTEWGEETTQDRSYYYMDTRAGKKDYEAKAYYTESNQLKWVGIYRDYFLHGESSAYHPNGQLHYKTNCYKGKQHGTVDVFYPNGKLQSVEVFDSLKAPDPKKPVTIHCRVEQYYDSSGVQLVKNGNGFLVEYGKFFKGYRVEKGLIRNGMRDSIWNAYHYPSGKIHYSENWSNGVLTKGVSFDSLNQEYEYQSLTTEAGPSGGMETFYEYVGQSMKYPKLARRLGVEGRVFASFVVERDGSVSDVKVIRGIGAGCDEEAVRVIHASPKWKPAEQRGQPVRQRFNLALIFKLR